ncbi:MAG: hypothetical protein ACKOSS_01995 [Planctomycetia bacterium]
MSRPSLLQRLSVAVLAATLCLLPGCMKLDQSVSVSKDGSGTVNMKMVMDMGKMEELMAMFKGMQPPAAEGQEQEDPAKELEEKLDIEEMKKQLAGRKGLEVVSATPIDDAEKKLKGFEAKIKFATLEDWFRSGMDTMHTTKLEQAGDGLWKLTRQRDLPGGAEGGGEEAAAQMEMFKPMLEPMMGELSMTFSISVPGTIVETTGKKDESGKVVSWKMGFAELMSTKVEPMVIVFKPEGAVTLKAFHVTTDQEGHVSEPGAPKPAPAVTPQEELPGEEPAPAPVEPK